MVDIHCHILPGVDDGAESWEIAIEMCEIAIKDGIDHIVASPHANDEYKYDREKHQACLDQLHEKIDGKLKFSLGCDFHLSYDNIQDLFAHPERYCIGESRYLLVEFSDFGLPPNTTELFSQLILRRITPIVTHPERNPLLQRSPKQVVEWANEGALVQVTANSLTGRWGSTAKKTIKYLAEHGAVHVLATDAHDTRSRPPILSAAQAEMAKIVGDDAARAMVEDIPRAIVSGQLLTTA